MGVSTPTPIGGEAAEFIRIGPHSCGLYGVAPTYPAGRAPMGMDMGMGDDMPLNGTDDGMNGLDMVAGVGRVLPPRYATPLNDVVMAGGWTAFSRRRGGGRGAMLGDGEEGNSWGVGVDVEGGGCGCGCGCGCGLAGGQLSSRHDPRRR